MILWLRVCIGCREKVVQGIAHVWEFIQGRAQSGTVVEIRGDLKHPRAKIVRDMLERHHRRISDAEFAQDLGQHIHLPQTDLAQPNAVFHAQV